MRKGRIARYALIGLYLLAISFSCSKSEDPAPTVGCQVTFKGTPVSMPDVVCAEFNGMPSVTATNSPAEQELVLINSASVKSISFVVSGDPNSYYSSTFSPAPPTISVSEKTWTFSGILVTASGDSGSISGTCTCLN